jgi:hypothetical protein
MGTIIYLHINMKMHRQNTDIDIKIYKVHEQLVCPIQLFDIIAEGGTRCSQTGHTVLVHSVLRTRGSQISLRFSQKCNT